jgi:DNA-binding IclR family transcriptional regulator
MTEKSQSLERGLAILDLIDGAGGTLGIRDIGRRLDLSPTIVQRLVQALVERNFVVKDAETQKYGLGYRALSLGASLLSEDNLISAAMPVLGRLTRELEVNAFLSVVSGDQLVYVLALQSEGPISIRSAPGTAAAFHSTAMGKAILAEAPPQRAGTLLGTAPLTAFTDHTITERTVLFEQIEEVRRQGYATSIEENLPGVHAVGACVRNAQGQAIAAISIAYAPLLQPKVQLSQAVLGVARAARDISLGLGCPDGLVKLPSTLKRVDGDVA